MAITECKERTKVLDSSGSEKGTGKNDASDYTSKPAPALIEEGQDAIKTEAPETREAEEKSCEVFICCREHEDDGSQTQDYQIAKDLYFRLKRQGRTVFLPGEDLKDTEAKEAYINEALENAKVMVVAGTSKESFEAIRELWVRFLDLTKNDGNRNLLPCFRKMASGELPSELSNLAFCDLNRKGSMKYLVRTIGRIFKALAKPDSDNRTEKNTAEPVSLPDAETVSTESGADADAVTVNTESEADADAVAASTESEAYVIAASAESGAYVVTVSQEEETKGTEAVEAASVQVGVIESGEAQAEEILTPEQQEEEYRNACELQDEAETPEELGEAAAIFQRLGIYRDSEIKLRECLEEKAIWEKEDRSFFEKFRDWRRNSPSLNRMRENRRKLWNNIKEKPVLLRSTIALIVLTVIGIAALITFKLILPDRDYKSAQAMITSKDYDGAIELLSGLHGFRDSDRLIEEVPYLKAEDILSNGDEVHAAMAFGKLGNYADSRERSMELWKGIARRRTISCGRIHSVALKNQGTVVAEGANNLKQCEVKEWTDIIAVSASGNHTLGLKSDGTVLATGDNSTKQCEVSGWTDIVAIYAGSAHSLGLKSDGTVVAAGTNENGECNVSEWSDIIGIAGSGSYSLGLKADGTVVAAGTSADGACNAVEWTDIIAIEASERHAVGLKADGTVVAAGANNFGQCSVSNVAEIKDIAVSAFNSMFLKADGGVLLLGKKLKIGVWSGIVEIASGFESGARGGHAIGLKSNGTIIAVGNNYSYQCRIAERKDVMLPYVKEDKEAASAKAAALE